MIVVKSAANGIGLYFQKYTIWRNSRSRIVNMKASEVLWMKTLVEENNNDVGRAGPAANGIGLYLWLGGIADPAPEGE